MEVSSTGSVKTAALASDGVSTSIEVHDAGAVARRCAFLPTALVYGKESVTRISETMLSNQSRMMRQAIAHSYITRFSAPFSNVGTLQRCQNSSILARPIEL